MELNFQTKEGGTPLSKVSFGSIWWLKPTGIREDNHDK
jgi:hypothetical protein